MITKFQNVSQVAINFSIPYVVLNQPVIGTEKKQILEVCTEVDHAIVDESHDLEQKEPKEVDKHVINEVDPHVADR